ncbi:Putative pleckstrin domain, PH-like domain superfamily [Colletotrichum destructivum]|uniref:Pleckstrin domain, PH-like domain superfamily n=1 Tax=Colletotrichum destructivum TaxID=34406 RepID=A0AAX4HX63_9PEZI|nr:Putative pleckstrin domain, PH-like domain superfamily [Colletotrichum destructivum]
MDPRSHQRGNGPSTTDAQPPPLRRRLSMEEDYFYQEVMTSPFRRPSQPPPYERDAKPKRPLAGRDDVQHGMEEGLPGYSCDIELEGVWVKKMEIENTTKRAEDRNWHTAFVQLRGTALNFYNVKKDWGWGRTRDGPTISPDNPPWVRKASLDKAYSLQHADVGIAADYKKRRYVIRVRAETDQFLLSCIELSTMVKWLEALFAAIDVAAPIDDRDYPRDQSIPRIQRIRWFRGQTPAQTNNYPVPTPRPLSPELRRVTSVEVSEPFPSSSVMEAILDEPVIDESPIGEDGTAVVDTDSMYGPGPARNEQISSRLSTTSYPNEAIDPDTGKWAPEHQWTAAHDLLYAKLCYSVLLFKSPRKSNYIISKGKQWFVDWATGRMVRVLPPAYGEIDFFGPWQVIHTENRRI